MKKTLLSLCLILFGVTSCNSTQQQQPTTKKSQPARQGQNTPNCPKEDPCDPCS